MKIYNPSFQQLILQRVLPTLLVFWVEKLRGAASEDSVHYLCEEPQTLEWRLIRVMQVEASRIRWLFFWEGWGRSLRASSGCKVSVGKVVFAGWRFGQTDSHQVPETHGMGT